MRLAVPVHSYTFRCLHAPTDPARQAAAYAFFQPRHRTRVAGVNEYWSMFKFVAPRGMALSNTLATTSCAAALGAYFAGGDNKDPAWLTCALASGLLPIYNLMLLTPTKSVIENTRMIDQPLSEREGWLLSWGRKKYLEVALACAGFGAMLLVLGMEKEEAAGRA